MTARIPATPNDLWTNLVRMAAHMDLGCRMTFEGHLDADTLRRAVRLSLDAEPVLGCSLVTGWYAGRWERRDDLDEHLPFSMAMSSRPNADATAFRAEQIPQAGPQVSVLLLRSAMQDDVCVKISHVAADGQGAKQYAYLLAEIYTRLCEDPAYEPQPNPEPRATGMDALEAILPAQRETLKRAPSALMANWDIPRRGTTGEGQASRELRLDPERFGALKRYGRQRGASVNDMLLTAFFRALTRSFEPPDGTKMSFTSTADHRRFIPSAEGMAITNISISGFLALEYARGEGFDETLARTVGVMDDWRASGYGVEGQKQAAAMSRVGYAGMKMLYRGILRMTGRSGKALPIFTNFGILDAGRLSFAGVAPLAAHMTGPAPFGSSMVPTISTYLDTLTVSVGFCEGDMDAALVEGVLAHMDEELRTDASAEEPEIARG